MKRFFLFLSAWIMQHSLLFAQSEQQLRDAQRAVFEARQVVDPVTGKIPADKLLEAYQTTQQYAPKAVGPNWIEMGPKNRVGGRVRSIVISPNKKKMFAGGITGGLWVSNYADIPDWKPVSDIFNNLNVSTIAYDPTNSNIMYLGTGEDYRNDFLPPANLLAWASDYNRGAGIWKSLDGGNTWVALSATIGNANDFIFRVVRKIVVDGTGRIFAATRSGVQRSDDGGNSWRTSLNGGTAVLGGIVPVSLNQVSDLEVGTDNTIYASIGLKQDSSAVYRLTDAIWRRLNDGEAVNGMAISGKFRRIELACAPSDSNIVYAFTENLTSSAAQPSVTLYRSSDRGLNWSKISMNTYPNGIAGVNDGHDQAYYSLAIAVNPNNANEVYLGGKNLYRCGNVTTSNPDWEQLSWWNLGEGHPYYIHADHHQIIFESAPLGSPNVAYVASDGGIFKVNYLNRLTGLGGVYCSNFNNNFRVSQFVTVAVSSGASSFDALGGLQDNGTEKFSESYLWLTANVNGGDGGYCFIHPDNTRLQVTSSQNGNYRISYNENGSYSYPGAFATHKPRGAFITPTDWIVLGRDTVNMISDGRYGAISQIFRWNHIFGTNPTVDSFAHPLLNGYDISFIKVSPNNKNRVYIGLTKAYMSYLIPADSIRIVKVEGINTTTPTFTDVTGGLRMKGYISCIAIKKSGTTQDNDMVFTLSNYGVTSVWKTDFGYLSNPNWYNLDQDGGSLPDMPIRGALFPPDMNAFGHKLLLATEMGVWATTNFDRATTVWSPINNGVLPKVRTQMLAYRSSDSMVFAATHGRGLWRTDMYNSSKVDFSANITVSDVWVPVNMGYKVKWVLRKSCTLNLVDLSTEVRSRAWDVNNDGSVESNLATVSVPYCGEQDVKLTINGVGMVKRLQDFINIPTVCPSCASFEPVPEPLGFFNKKATEEESMSDLIVYPNPNQGIFNIRMEPDWGKIEQIEVYNSTGKLIQISESAIGEINIEQEPTGIYMCRVKTSKGKILVGKVLKQ